jgi:archaeosine-15-forming tRNA-guanine transglycosylase
MDSIVNYIKAGRSVVFKFQVFADSEEKTNADNVASFTYSIVYQG